ncbi:class II fructose-bisphosphate aldolase [Azospirillum soli]|uniref:class II fructose-bisphosphate aldolase n=1 Tax=Azospirillum soli TaxID=1304799 RepID=UPI001AEAC429|nr:class II fructose-bisphosphate aldolase [Azospirillum soli]MBP2314166.1 fructose-bisphosphate aldolase class II [Azospirillum soli]
MPTETKLQPGVVTGEDYRRLVAACQEGGYALPAVNVVGTNSVNAVLEAAAKNRSDVIVQLSNGGARFFAGEGMKDALQARILGAVSAAQHVHLLAKEYGVCVVLHTDHANKGLIPWVEGMIAHGEEFFRRTGKPLFSSHMLDLSEEPLEENLAECARILKRLAPLGMALEIELGVTGGEEDGIGSEDLEAADNARLYTQPEDVLHAYELLSPIGTFSVAASFGNVHGVYAPGNVKLRPEILGASQELVAQRHGGGKKPLALVFHGGSGSEKEKIAQAVGFGVFKMNIDTDTQFAFAESIGRFVLENEAAFRHQIHPETGKPLKKLYDPRKWLREGEAGIVRRLDEAFADLGSAGRTLAG